MLVGRGTECEAIECALTAARSGTCSLLVLHGEAGIGKTALLDHAAAAADGLTTLRVVGVRGEADGRSPASWN